MFSEPKVNLEQFGLEKGMKVADLGAGPGFYALEAARIVGPEGRVFCIDVQKELVATVKKEALSEGLDNVEAIWGDIEKVGGTKLKDETLDACILSNVLFQVEDKSGLAKETKRILREGGKLLIVDWLGSFGGLGPDKMNVFTKEKAESLFTMEGLKKERDIDAGDQHYGMVFVKS